MQQVSITKENGVTLTEAKTIAIDPEKIVTTKSDSSSNTQIVYAGILDRRIKPMEWTVTNTKATVDGWITGTKLALTTYNPVDGTTYTLGLQSKYVRQIRDTYAQINNTRTACREVMYSFGAFKTVKVYVSNSLASLATAIVTTTTTTTAAPTTTTTTAAPTTTTTAAPTTTTTTTAPATTTTTTAAATTTTTAVA